MSKKNYKICLYIVVGLSFLLYGNTLTNDYSFDDTYVMVGNKKVEQGFAGISTIFKTRYLESADQNYGYRPITLTSFAIEYQFFGATPAVSHFINLLLYILTCLLIFKILRTLFKNNHWFLPFLVTVLFLIHPIHTEVVNNIKCRDELLCFLFALLALHSAIKYARNKSKGWLFGVFAFMVLSFLSKLSSLTFLAVIPLTIYFFESSDRKIILKLIGVLLIPIAFYMLINTQLIDVTGNRNLLFIENPLFVNGAGFFEKIPMAFYSVYYYMKLLIFPHPLISYYGYQEVTIVGWENMYVWVGVIITLPLLIFTIWKLKTKSVLVYGLAYFFITISMFSNLVKPAVGIIAERFAYIPSLGFSIVLAWLLLKILKVDISTVSLEKFPKLKFAFFGIVSILFVASFAKIFTRNQDWKDLVTILERDLEVAPKSVKLNMLLADELFSRVTKNKLGAKEKDSLLNSATFYYNQAVEMYPDHIPAHNNLGALYNMKGDFKKSQEEFLKASKDPKPRAKTFLNLGLSYYAIKDNEKAIESLNRSIEIDGNQEAYYNLMNIYYEDGKMAEALETNIKMFRLFPALRRKLLPVGQKIAENIYGPKTLVYLNQLYEKKLIQQKAYENIKKQLTASVMEN